jgi:hypothetical protein
MTARDDLIARIRKLRERAATDAGAEGRTAGNLARTLMREHRIRESDLRPPRPPAPPKPPRPPRRPFPVALDLNIAGIRIKWDGKL